MHTRTPPSLNHKVCLAEGLNEHIQEEKGRYTQKSYGPTSQGAPSHLGNRGAFWLASHAGKAERCKSPYICPCFFFIWLHDRAKKSGRMKQEMIGVRRVDGVLDLVAPSSVYASAPIFRLEIATPSDSKLLGTYSPASGGARARFERSSVFLWARPLFFDFVGPKSDWVGSDPSR